MTALIPIGLRLGAAAGCDDARRAGALRLVFALNSSVHSYLVLAYSEADRVSLSVGFYYMANACGRLLGTLLSGVLYQQAGVAASLWGAVVLAAGAGGRRDVPAAGRQRHRFRGRVLQERTRAGEWKATLADLIKADAEHRLLCPRADSVYAARERSHARRRTLGYRFLTRIAPNEHYATP